ncbi:MAG: type II secretion system major pseudopilin GspG [Phycisphaerales bacterium]
MKNTRRPTPVRRAFTLIEVMIVIAIILALTGLIGVALFNRRDDAKRDTVLIDINSMKAAMDLFRHDFERYPKDEEGVKVLWDKTALDAEADQTKWKGYLKEPMPTDRWGSPWGYRQASEHGDETKFDLWSYGADKQDGTEDDLNSWVDSAADGGAGPSDLPPAPRPK